MTSLLPWQHQAWAHIQQLQGRWPHAILLHGPAGIGKTIFAEIIGQSLLCESPQADGHACGTCASCGWFKLYSHPDYRRLRPENLETDANESDSTEGTESKAKATKVPSKEIVIDQVRSLSDFMTMSTHRQGKRVVVIYPADAMNTAAANALLKSLEEPGPNTIFILVTCHVDSLLPTLVSRCHQFALTVPDMGQALQWLIQQKSQQKMSDPEGLLAEFGGAPLAALAVSQSDTQEHQQDFLRCLHQPDIDTALRTADKLQKLAIPLLLSWMQRWLFDVFSYKLTGKIRYYPRYKKEITSIAERFEMAKLLALVNSTIERRAVAEHPLSPKLVIEEMLLDYVGSCQ